MPDAKHPKKTAWPFLAGERRVYIFVVLGAGPSVSTGAWIIEGHESPKKGLLVRSEWVACKHAEMKSCFHLTSSLFLIRRVL